MTGQIHDLLCYNGEDYSIVGVEAEKVGDKRKPLFDPFQYGFSPKMMHTACYRGFYSSYSIIDNKLYLTHLVINDPTVILTGRMETKLLDGKAPLYEPTRSNLGPNEPDIPKLRGRSVAYSYKGDEKNYSISYSGLIYTGIKIPITHFSGRLLIGRDFQRNRYIHMGFQSPNSYGTVREIVVDNGIVVEVVVKTPSPNSRSGRDGKPDPNDSVQVASWINDRFSLKIED